MKLSDSEWTVMNVLWQNHPASARDILEALPPGTDWAYTTVKTILTRLEDKGTLRSTLRGNTKHFEPLITRDKARRTAVRSLIDRAFGGATGALFHHLVEEDKIPENKRAELAKLLDEIRADDKQP